VAKKCVCLCRGVIAQRQRDTRRQRRDNPALSKRSRRQATRRDLSRSSIIALVKLRRGSPPSFEHIARARQDCRPGAVPDHLGAPADGHSRLAAVIAAAGSSLGRAYGRAERGCRSRTEQVLCLETCQANEANHLSQEPRSVEDGREATRRRPAGRALKQYGELASIARPAASGPVVGRPGDR
jgi:hypothetical protein